VQEKGLELVIDGMTLARVLGRREDEMLLASMVIRCTGVVVCRATPAQKARIVEMMKRYHALKEVHPHSPSLPTAVANKIYP
jgi:magnesium-transporting ATPase (P-type)